MRVTGCSRLQGRQTDATSRWKSHTATQGDSHTLGGNPCPSSEIRSERVVSALCKFSPFGSPERPFRTEARSLRHRALKSHLCHLGTVLYPSRLYFPYLKFCPWVLSPEAIVTSSLQERKWEIRGLVTSRTIPAPPASCGERPWEPRLGRAPGSCCEAESLQGPTPWTAGAGEHPHPWVPQPRRDLQRDLATYTGSGFSEESQC